MVEFLGHGILIFAGLLFSLVLWRHIRRNNMGCCGKGLHFKVDQLKNLAMREDKLELKQPFFNLLDNAIRYILAGGTISVSPWKDKEILLW